ncbi:glucose-6-phosphate isomerase [Nocardioidaceae bacterium]|nr:glucose-6-phosphate isomerase [Nocardioidaceae bacterium]
MTGTRVHVHAAVPEALGATIEQLVADQVASGIAAQDPTLWGPDAEDEAGKRLSWVDLPEQSQHLVPRITALRQTLTERGVRRIVLCGMGGSSLAPEVICAAHGVDLVTLDSSEPDMVRAAVSTDLASTAVVVSSKSGSTVETASQKRAFEQAFREAGIDPADRVVVVTDPGSPLEREATEAGYEVFHADPEVGGRYSAMTAFGLVPSGLAGADIQGLLDEGRTVLDQLRLDAADNPAVQLGGLLGLAANGGVDKLVLADAGASFARIGDWIEQLVAESTGKHGKGILPVVVESASAPNFVPSTTDSVLVATGPDDVLAGTSPASGWAARIDASLGAQMVLWEFAVAVAGRVIGINPFDQPDVESAKAAARSMLDGGDGTGSEPDAVDGDIELRTPGGWAAEESTDTLEEALRALLAQLDPARGYVAVMAYLDRHALGELERIRASLATRTGRPVTFGWGPRFLHSTGQLHKGGPAVGVYLQITGEPTADLEVEGQDFSFGRLVAAQAAGDAGVLADDHGRPVLRLHLRDQRGGIDRLLAAAEG